MEKLVPSSFDIIGSREKAVAIVEIPEEVNGKEAAEVILKNHKNVKTVLQKTSKRKGEFRVREYKLLAGDTDTEVMHKEYGYVVKVDPQKAYFSPRESTERQRIAKQVKAGEVVMVMFSGVAPFAIAIAKKHPEVERVIVVEMNPEAVKYADENIRINKLGHKILSLEGDVREACVKWYGKCNRVVMPLPLGSEDFLDIAVNCLKDSGVIHFYNWGEEPEVFAKAEKLIDEKLKKMGREYKIIDRCVVLPYSPKRYKVCIDVEVGGTKKKV
jgi:tRNA (guanine37-N1)-methyltransferase